MQVTSGAKPNSKYIEITLSEDDVRTKDWDEKKTIEKWKHMTRVADTLLVEYMLRSGDISKEMADQRMREIQDG